jgi:hypothetical protein
VIKSSASTARAGAGESRAGAGESRAGAGESRARARGSHARAESRDPQTCPTVFVLHRRQIVIRESRTRNLSQPRMICPHTIKTVHVES